MIQVAARIQDLFGGPPVLHLCVFADAAMAEQSSTEHCGTFRYRHEAEQMANLLDGLGHGDAAVHVRDLANQLPES